MNTFKAKSMQIICKNTIQAPIDETFQLLCPVEEYKWIDGWKCQLIHCPNDHIEQGCVFSEIFSAPFLQGNFNGKTTWTTVLYDLQNHIVRFQLANAISSSLYQISLQDDGNGAIVCQLEFTYQALNNKGNHVIENNGEQKIYLMLHFLSEMLKHYAQTQTMLKTGPMIKMVLHNRQLSYRDKVNISLNRLSMFLMKDPDRDRILSVAA